MDLVMGDAVATSGGEVVKNLCTGMKYERAPVPCVGQVYCNGSAAGLTLEVSVDSLAVTDTLKINAANAQPKVPEDILATFEADAGALIQLKLVNTTASTALSAFWRVVLTPVAEMG
jgi:hypothetical protein